MLSKLIGPSEIMEYLRWITHATDWSQDLVEDAAFLRTLRRSFLAVPYLDREPVLDADLLPAWRPFTVESLADKRIGIVATGGGGAMVSALGVVRACEEAGLEIAAISACSGSALFLAPVAAGLSAQETLDFVFSWRLKDYVDPEWRQLLKLPLALGRGFSGLLNAESVELLYHARLGGVLVRDLPIPFYADVWDVEENRVLYMGTRSTPEVRLARLVRAAVTLPNLVQPVEIDGAVCGDGGVINTFPVEPLVRRHPEIDYFIGVNAALPEDFGGEELSCWDRRAFGPLRVSLQRQQGQILENARMQLRLIEDRCLMLHPVAYDQTSGVKLYQQFLDRKRWPEFVMRGYYHARRNLMLLDRLQAAA